MSRANESYWWWKEQIDNCPVCGCGCSLGKDAVSGQYMIVCMNCTCSNMTAVYNKSWRKSNSKLEQILSWKKRFYYIRGDEMSKSELLANEINQKEIELLQDRIDNNSKLINDLTNKLVADYCKQLDRYITAVRDMLNDFKNPPTAEELDYIVMELPVLLYFCGEAQENLGIKTDVAKAVKMEKYNAIYNNIQGGTISDKTSQSELAVQNEEITRIVYDRAYKIVKEKMEYATELLSSIKKVITRRISEYELGGVDDGRFRRK